MDKYICVEDFGHIGDIPIVSDYRHISPIKKGEIVFLEICHDLSFGACDENGGIIKCYNKYDEYKHHFMLYSAYVKAKYREEQINEILND